MPRRKSPNRPAKPPLPNKSPPAAEPFAPVLLWLWAFALAPQALAAFILQAGLEGDLPAVFAGDADIAGAACALALYFGSPGACLYVSARLLQALRGTLPVSMRPWPACAAAAFWAYLALRSGFPPASLARAAAAAACLIPLPQPSAKSQTTPLALLALLLAAALWIFSGLSWR